MTRLRLPRKHSKAWVSDITLSADGFGHLQLVNQVIAGFVDFRQMWFYSGTKLVNHLGRPLAKVNYLATKIGCADFGNVSLFLQIRHSRCKQCNECAIAVACPASAFKRVPVTNPYLMKTDVPKGGKA